MRAVETAKVVGKALRGPVALEVRRVGWDDKQPVLRPIRHAWRGSGVAHGRLGRARRLAKSFGNITTSATGWLLVTCVATVLRQLSRQPDTAADWAGAIVATELKTLVLYWSKTPSETGLNVPKSDPDGSSAVADR